MKYWQQVVVLLITCPVSFKTFTVAHATVVFHLGKAACNSCLCNQLANSIMIEFTSQHTTWHDSQINPQICTVLDILSCDLSSYPLVHLPYASLVSVHLAHPAAGAQTERCLLPPAVPHPHIHHFLRNLKGWNSPSRCTLTNYKHTANYKHMNDWFSKKTPGRCSILKSWHHLRVMGDVTLYLKTKLTANEITWSCRTICFIFISSIFDDLIWFDGICQFCWCPDLRHLFSKSNEDLLSFQHLTHHALPFQHVQIFLGFLQKSLRSGHGPWVNRYRRESNNWSYLCSIDRSIFGSNNFESTYAHETAHSHGALKKLEMLESTEGLRKETAGPSWLGKHRKAVLQKREDLFIY